jgi:hypothetical protein
MQLPNSVVNFVFEAAQIAGGVVLIIVAGPYVSGAVQAFMMAENIDGGGCGCDIGHNGSVAAFLRKGRAGITPFGFDLEVTVSRNISPV